LVAAQFERASSGQNVVIGAREYTSNFFPWRLLEPKGYEVRQVPFRDGGLEPDDVARAVDGGTVLVAFSGVQTGSGHCYFSRAVQDRFVPVNAGWKRPTSNGSSAHSRTPSADTPGCRRRRGRGGRRR
jgi:hypothetical protein